MTLVLKSIFIFYCFCALSALILAGFLLYTENKDLLKQVKDLFKDKED